MKAESRKIYNAYLSRVAEVNETEDTTVQFSVEPSVQQKLETKMQEDSTFLNSINVYPVDELKGEKIGLGIGGPVASNTDTTNKDRETSDPTNLDSRQYECRTNDSDTHITYKQIDTWAKFPDFVTRVRDVILKRQGLDRIMIGFNGTSYAADSDKVANPLLQDVNIGWLEHYRLEAEARVLDEGAAPGTITVKAGGDYENLDALVMDAKYNLIDPWFREDMGLVVIMGSDLLQDKYFPLVNQQQPSSEVIATDMIVSQKRVGGLQAVTAPYVPAGTMLITRLDNLSIYYQEGARRRYIQENPKRRRIENYESSNDDYVIEDYGLGCLIENIDTTPA